VHTVWTALYRNTPIY